MVRGVWLGSESLSGAAMLLDRRHIDAHLFQSYLHHHKWIAARAAYWPAEKIRDPHCWFLLFYKPMGQFVENNPKGLRICYFLPKGPLTYFSDFRSKILVEFAGSRPVQLHTSMEAELDGCPFTGLWCRWRKPADDGRAGPAVWQQAKSSGNPKNHNFPNKLIEFTVI